MPDQENSSLLPGLRIFLRKASTFNALKSSRTSCFKIEAIMIPTRRIMSPRTNFGTNAATATRPALIEVTNVSLC